MLKNQERAKIFTRNGVQFGIQSQNYYKVTL